MKKETAKEIFWIALLILILFFLMIGCKPQQIISERITVDSTAILKLQQEVQVKQKVIETLQTDLERSKEQSAKLLNEYMLHLINYDTTAPVNPETGEYPKASELFTQSKTEYERLEKENETLKQEYRKEVENLELIKTNLEKIVENLRQENTDLKTKGNPFNLNSFVWGIVVGVVLLLLVLIFIRK